MGFLSASTTVVRFVAAVPARLDREAVARAVTRRLFRELEGATAETHGWVALHDPLASVISPDDLFFHRWLVLGFRFDRRAVPAKLLWLERRRLEEARKTEQGLRRLGAAARREIKDEVYERLLARALPTPRLFECAWNLDRGHLFFTGKARAPREAFAELFQQTFGVRPVPMIPYLAVEHLGLSPAEVEAVRAVEPATLVARPASAPADIPRLAFAEHGVRP